MSVLKVPVQFENNDIKLAVSTADIAPNTAPLLLLGDICENLRKANMLGYSAIEIHTRENAQIDCKKILRACNELGMKISAIVTGRLHNEEKVTLIDDDSVKTKIALKGLKEYINIAQLLKTDIIIGWIRGNIPDKGKTDFYEKRLADNIKILADYALGKEVRIFIEAINRYEVNYLNTGIEILDFIKKYKIPNTFIHLDTFHMNIEEKSITDTIKQCADKLRYVHFADSNRKYPGAGHLDFLNILRTLKDINYEGYITIECLPKPTGEEAAKFAAQIIGSIENILRIEQER
jgi:sugar phosphate isomerase/epimerase